MRLNGAAATALYSSALLLGNTWAEDTEEPESSTSTVIETTTTSVIERPSFTVRCSEPLNILRLTVCRSNMTTSLAS